MPKTKHFDLKTKSALISEITAHKEADKNFTEIANLLNKKKQFTSSGKAWNPNNLQMFYYSNVKKLAPLAVVERAGGVTPKNAISKSLVLAILNESSLTERQKVDSLRALLNT